MCVCVHVRMRVGCVRMCVCVSVRTATMLMPHDGVVRMTPDRCAC
jgi:hypothetical protein